MPDKFICRPLLMTVHGMTHEVIRDGAEHPVLLAATAATGFIAAAAMTQAAAIAVADRERLDNDLRQREVEWLEERAKSFNEVGSRRNP